jgi:hypothetical protein
MTEHPIYNFYCDESCHLPMATDGLSLDSARQVMAIGGVWCPRERVREFTERLRAVKVRHGLGRTFELKWQKVSPAKAALYLELLDVFFAEEDLHFRGAVVPNKQAFFDFHKEASLGGDHDGAYYRLYFDMLKVVFDPRISYHIYLDAKDTRGRFKLADLRRTLNSKFYEVPAHVIGRLQEIRSHESDLLQLADIILGALTFVHRGMHEIPDANAGKIAIVRHLQEKTGYSLQRSTLHGESKLNLWVWHESHHPSDRQTQGVIIHEGR